MAAELVIQAIEVHPVQATPADLRKLEHLSTVSETPLPEVSYVVKLYLESLPPADALGYELYVGDQMIRKYSQFEKGIYFRTTSPEQLAVYRGQKVRFRRPGSDKFIETEVTFPALEARLDAVERSRAGALPTEEEVLRK